MRALAFAKAGFGFALLRVVDFLDVAFAIDKAFGIKMPLEQWTQEVNEGKTSSDEYFVLGGLCKNIDALVAAKG